MTDDEKLAEKYRHLAERLSRAFTALPIVGDERHRYVNARLDRLSFPWRTRLRARGPAEWQLPLHQIAELTSAWGNIAAKITDQSAHPATSRVLDPLQCLVVSLGEGDETALQSRRRTSQIAMP